MDTNDKVQICKVIAQAILADAQITDEEREFIDKLMDRYGLDDEQRRDVLNRNMGDSAADMARQISGLESKDELLGELLGAIAADGKVAPQERTLLVRVGEAIGMTADEVDLVLED